MAAYTCKNSAASAVPNGFIRESLGTWSVQPSGLVVKSLKSKSKESQVQVHNAQVRDQAS